MMRRVLIVAAALLALAAPAAAQTAFGTTPLVVTANGTTGAVTATLPASTVGKTTWICGLTVSAAGGTATISPITITGPLGGTITYQGVSAGGAPFSPPGFSPCIPANAPNTAISVATTADGTATAVNVTAWGFQL